MLSRFFLCAILLCALLIAAGCNLVMGGARLVSVAPVVPPRGFFYSHYKAPLVLPAPAEIGQTPRLDGNSVVYFKIPTPYMNTEFSMGRADIEAACRRAGIKTLIGADYEYLSVAGYVKTFTIHAYGYP